MNDLIARKKIGLFTGKLASGGAERFVCRLADALMEYYDVFVLVYNVHKKDYDTRAQIIDLSDGSSSFVMRLLKAAKNLDKTVNRLGLSLVISFLDWPNILNGLCNHSCRRAVSIRAYYNKAEGLGFTGAVKYPLIKMAFKAADSIVVLSSLQAVITAADMNIEKDRFAVVKNFFDVENIHMLSLKPIEDSSIAEMTGEKTALAVGRLTAQKNYFELLEVFRIVNQKDPQTRLIILGEGKLSGRLKKRCRKLQLDGKVLFAGRIDNPFAVMGRCGMYISMSLFEGFPNALVEAMVCQMPVMHSKCMTGPGEILGSETPDKYTGHVEYSKYGILLPVCNKKTENPEEKRAEIAKAWLKLTGDKKMREEYSSRAKTGGCRYASEMIIPQYMELIEH